jgi:hypothetical protein
MKIFIGVFEEEIPIGLVKEKVPKARSTDRLFPFP